LPRSIAFSQARAARPRRGVVRSRTIESHAIDR